MGFFIALAGMERVALFSGGVSCAALWQVFLYRYSKKEEIFFIRCEAKNVYPLTMGSLFARRDYDIIYTTMSTPFCKAADDALGIGAAMSFVRCTILQSL